MRNETVQNGLSWQRLAEQKRAFDEWYEQMDRRLRKLEQQMIEKARRKQKGAERDKPAE